VLVDPTLIERESAIALVGGTKKGKKK